MNRRVLDERIVSDPAVLLGKPIIRGTRVPVYLVVGLIEAGQTPEQIVDDYPDLTIVDVEAAVAYAARESARTEVRAPISWRFKRRSSASRSWAAGSRRDIIEREEGARCRST